MGACARNLHCVLYEGYLWWNALLQKHKSPSKDTSFRMQRQSEGFLLGRANWSSLWLITCFL
jgi:hypothetical protein